MKKKIGILIIILLISIQIIIIKKEEQAKIKIPNKSPIAYIYHSENSGIDEGTEYLYYFYQKNHIYIYEKKIAKITIKGSSKAKRKKIGELKTIKEFQIIEKDIKKDIKKKKKTYIHYYYYQDNEYKQLKSIDELKKKLFS